MFQGPFDGTTLLDRLYTADDLEEGVEEYIEQERQREQESDRESMYRDDNGSWKRDRIKTVVAAGLKTGEDAICGRWAGDDVRLVGDYADNDVYAQPRGTVTARDPETGETFEYASSHPDIVEPIPDGQRGDHRHIRKEATPGDTINTQYVDATNADYAEFVSHTRGEWDDITDSVLAEMARYMPDKFEGLREEYFGLDGEENDPDIVFGSGENKATRKQAQKN